MLGGRFVILSEYSWWVRNSAMVIKRRVKQPSESLHLLRAYVDKGKIAGSVTKRCEPNAGSTDDFQQTVQASRGVRRLHIRKPLGST